MSLPKENINVWHKSAPIEKSSYTIEDDIEIFNKDKFSLDKDKPTMIDLFCGAGGFSLGCEWAGFQSVLGLDYLKPALDTWKHNNPNSISVLGDITKISPKLLRKNLEELGVNHINLITGGVPCQGFSLANRKHNSEDDRNYLFIDYMKIVEEFQPDYIILENVSGMRSTAGGKFEKDILNYMDNLGYNANVELLNSAEFGVPQVRNRLIFVGIKRNRGLKSMYEFPKAKYGKKGSGLKDFLTVGDAISDLPNLNSHESAEEYTNEPKTEYQKLMRGHNNTLAIKKSDKIYNHVAPRHQQRTIDRISNTEPGEPMYDRFKQRIRLDSNLPSPTQLAGGIRPQFQFGHPTQLRGLTIRERARIQSFPDNFKFLGGTVQERILTGNAVPPLMIYNIALSIIKDIKKTKEL